MATCYLEEFKFLETDAQGNVLPVYGMPHVAAQTLDIDSDSDAFAIALNADTKFIRIWADQSIFFNVGDGDASAATGSLPALLVEPRAVKGGLIVKARTIA